MNGAHHLRARWISSTLLTCNLPGSLLLDNQVSLQVTNNGKDYSIRNLSIPIMNDFLVVEASPLQGSTLGGTPITLRFNSPVTQSVECAFGVKRVRSFKINTTSVVCISPALQDAEGEVVELGVFLSEHGAALSSTFEFEYVPFPVVNQVIPSTILSGIPCTVRVLGRNFRGDTILRVRDTSSKIQSDCSVESSLAMICDILASGSSRAILFELSSSGVEYSLIGHSVQLVKPILVAGMGAYKYSSVGEEMVKIVAVTTTGDGSSNFGGLECVFDQSLDDGSSTIVSLHGLHIHQPHCITPKSLSPGIVLFSISQYGHMIFGPIQLLVEPEISIKNVFPPVIVAGQSTNMLVEFAYPIGMSELQCILDGSSSPMWQLNSTFAQCSVNALQAGSELAQREMKIMSTLNLDFELSVPITVKVRPMELKVNTSFVPHGEKSALMISSKNCEFSEEFSCFVSHGQAHRTSGDNCSIICEVFPPPNRKQFYLSLCSTPSCNVVYFIDSIEAYAVSVIVGISPSIGPVQGSNEVTITGYGFDSYQDQLNCSFGGMETRARVGSTSIVRCLSIGTEPGVKVLNLVYMGMKVNVGTPVTYEFKPMVPVSSDPNQRTSPPYLV